MSFYSIAPFIKENYPQYYSVGEYPADKCAPFCKVDGEWGIFGNFGRTPLIVGGVVFKTSEQLFQLMKFRGAEEDAIKAVYAAGNPKMTTKKWEKQCRREDWGTMIVDAMKFCLVTKYAQSAEFRAELEAVGFSFSTGKFTVTVDAIPVGLEADQVAQMLPVIAERLQSGTGNATLTRDIVFEKALYQGACKAAIKAGRVYAPEHLAWVVDQLMALPDITYCPHGRPVAMEMSKKNLDRQFERS